MRLRNQSEFLYSAITSRESASSRKRKFCHAKFLTAHFSPGDRVPRVFRNVFADGISHTVLRTNLRLRSEEHTSELQSLRHLVCRLLPVTNTSTSSVATHLTLLAGRVPTALSSRAS